MVDREQLRRDGFSEAEIDKIDFYCEAQAQAGKLDRTATPLVTEGEIKLVCATAAEAVRTVWKQRGYGGGGDRTGLAGAAPTPDGLPDDDPFMRALEEMAGYERERRSAPPVVKSELFDRLRAAGIVRVAVEYDGSGDSGCVESVRAYGAGGDPTDLPEDLLDLVEEYVLVRLPDGWEIDDGSFGEAEFDVPAATVTFDHNRRFTEITSHEWEE